MSNTISVTGNLGRDGELKYLPSGAAVLELAIADTPRRKTDTGWEDAGERVWYRASVWGPLAEALANSGAIVKGAQVTVTGTLTQRTYEKDGQQRTSLDIRAETVGVREKRGATQQQPQQQGQAWSPDQPQGDPWATPTTGAQGGASGGAPF